RQCARPALVRFCEDELILPIRDVGHPERVAEPLRSRRARETRYGRRGLRRIEVLATVRAAAVLAEIRGQSRIVARIHDVREKLPAFDVVPERRTLKL